MLCCISVAMVVVVVVVVGLQRRCSSNFPRLLPLSSFLLMLLFIWLHIFKTRERLESRNELN